MKEDMKLNNSTSEKKYPCVFSVVMAVYNCEPFLRETLDSIVNQDIENIVRYENGVPTEEKIPFEELVEVIMVDDGSKDSSGAICDEYAEKYPNFKVIHKPNGGVASARNEGLKHVRGKYMNFLDSDDTFSPNVFLEMYKFFETHYNETDVITMPLQFFDAVTGPHWQNYKFKKYARIANLYNEYDCPLMFVNASFFKSEYKDRVSFNGKLVCGEDIRFICEILSEKMTMGLVPYCHYGYRRRSSGEESLVQSSKKKVGWYFDYFENLTLWAVDFAMNKWGYIPYYYQHIIVCDLQWRFLNDYESTAIQVLGEAEYERYKTVLYDCLKYFDDKIILGQRNIWDEHKCMMLKKKYGRDPELCKFEDDVRLRFANTTFCWLSNCLTRYDFIKIEDGNLIIEGYSMLLGYPDDADIKVFFRAKDTGSDSYYMLECETPERDANRYRLDEVLFRGIPFRLSTPISDLKDTSLELAVIANGDLIVKKDIRYSKFTPIGKEFKNSYYYEDGHMLTCDSRFIRVKACKKSAARKKKRAFIKELSRSNKLGAKKASLVYRVLDVLKLFKRKPLVIISDRINKAGDNGEALFRYLVENKVKDFNYVFAIEKDSPDYERIKRIGGKVVNMSSHKYKLMHLMSDCTVSSHADDITANPFTYYFAPYRNFVASQKYVFLQHGVTKDNVADWLGRYSKNLTGLVCAATPEADAFMGIEYGYSAENIWRTGFPRFDRLYNDDKKYITVMPTWRMYLSAWDSSHEGVWKLSASFTNSAYYKFYNALINDERLIAAAKAKGYTLCFMPHPNVMNYIDVFDKHPDVKFFGFDKEYRDIYAESSLVLTDYSSAVFDFAYLRKPVVYTQFDKDEFFAGNHAYTKGYFDYEDDGFGEVTYDYDATVDLLIKYIESGCKLDDKYRERIDSFFLFNDSESSKRVCEKITRLIK